jgi:hypothetical protein
MLFQPIGLQIRATGAIPGRAVAVRGADPRRGRFGVAGERDMPLRFLASFIVVTVAAVTAVCAPLCLVARASTHPKCHGGHSQHHVAYEPEATDALPHPLPGDRAPSDASDCCCPTLGAPDKRAQPEIDIPNAPIGGAVSWWGPVTTQRLRALGSPANARYGPRLPLYLVECSLLI